MTAFSDFDAAMVAATTAYAASNYAETRKQLDLAAMHQVRDAKSGSDGAASHTNYGPEDIESLRALVDKAESRAGKTQVISRWHI